MNVGRLEQLGCGPGGVVGQAATFLVLSVLGKPVPQRLRFYGLQRPTYDVVNPGDWDPYFSPDGRARLGLRLLFRSHRSEGPALGEPALDLLGEVKPAPGRHDGQQDEWEEVFRWVLPEVEVRV